MLVPSAPKYESLLSESLAVARHEMTHTMGIDHQSNVLIITDQTREDNPLVLELVEECCLRGATLQVFKRDLVRTAELLQNKQGLMEIRRHLNELQMLSSWADKIIIVRAPENEAALYHIDPRLMKIYDDGYNQATKIRLSKRWMLTVYPTEAMAEKEGMEFKEFERIILNSWRQPWDEIKSAQDKLIQMLDAGNQLRFISQTHADDSVPHTDLTMNITGMTFVNSASDSQNFPGAEVYSAPIKESVEGSFYAPGKFPLLNGIVSDLYLFFEKGRVVEARASVGQALLERFLSSHEANNFLGEIGIGNNPALWQHFLKAIYCEKRAGSFHIALGHCFTFTEHCGKTIKVNNQNTDTPHHWDIAVSMLPRFGGGQIILDNKVIQRDGYWCDPELKCLWPN